jgi:chemosensory pili system protein ChpB (putative protein-glutamate methylesterase)
MSHAAPAVALLFDDVELGEQLRLALNECGAHIVHEGGMATLTRELLESVGAQVLVVNLDDSAADALDHLYEVIDGDTLRVVFNDAEASSALTGWDRARWARHLAVKVLEMGDIDPPRPEDAQVVETTSAPAFEAAATDDSNADEGHEARPQPVQPAVPVADADAAEFPEAEVRPEEIDFVDVFNDEADAPWDDTADAHQYSAPAVELPSATAEPTLADTHERMGQPASDESENLTAELEALLASGELSVEDDAPTGCGLRFTGDEALPPLHDGHFGPAAGEELDHRALSASQNSHATAKVDAEAGPSSVTPPVFQLDHLELAPMNDTVLATIPTASLDQIPAAALAAKTKIPDSWALLDEADETADAAGAPGEKAAATDFGIQKVSAIDFLAPDARQAAADDELTMSLQLVSMEEAIAPTSYEDPEEVRANRLAQVVLLGATADATESVCRFLGAVPANTRLAFVHTQHLDETSVDALVETLAAHSALPVRVACEESRARIGEVIVVPAGRQLRLVRDGSVELAPFDIKASHGPSIDASFSMAANVFGRDALAIVFSGRGNDAAAGAQAIHDRGGKVWVESAAAEHDAGMVHGISAERLVSFSGTPHELAAHLIEVFP